MRSWSTRLVVLMGRSRSRLSTNPPDSSHSMAPRRVEHPRSRIHKVEHAAACHPIRDRAMSPLSRCTDSEPLPSEAKLIFIAGGRLSQKLAGNGIGDYRPVSHE